MNEKIEIVLLIVELKNNEQTGVGVFYLWAGNPCEINRNIKRLLVRV